MKRIAVAAVTLALTVFFSPVAGAASVPPTAEGTPGEAGSALEHVQLDTLAGGPESNAGPAPLATEPSANLGADLSMPAGPEIVSPAQPKINSGVMPQSPQKAAKGAVSQINPNAPRAFVASPIDSVPGVVSFLLIMALCVGAGVSAAVVISWITGKKIELGLAK